MFRKTTPQLSLLEPTFMFPGILPEDDWSYIFRDKIWPLIDEDKFRHIYHEKGGAPNKSIKLKVSLLIFMALERITWRETEFLFRRRLDWMNATFTPFGEAFIDHTTLFKFFQALQGDDVNYALFADITRAFVEKCNVSTDKQRVDSFFMLGWLAILSRYGLFKETIKTFLQALRKHKPGLYGKIKDDLSVDYLKDNFDLTEKDKKKTKGRIKEMAKDLFQLKASFENHNQVKCYESFKTLVTVFSQQCKVTFSNDNIQSGGSAYFEDEKTEVLIPCEDEKGQDLDSPTPLVEIRTKPEGDKIISSPHNTDAEYTRKRNTKVVGHKGFVTETCDPSNEVQFITDVNLERSTHADANEIKRIEHRLEQNGFIPETLYGDAGFVNGDSILRSKEKGIDLAGPSSGRSQSIEDFADDDRVFDIADFEVQVNDNSKEITIISCPNGQRASDQKLSDKTGKILVHFSSATCNKCQTRQRCPVKIGVHVATLNVTEEQYAGAVRHHKYMESVEYRKECGIRSGAESLVNEVANGHGARKSRHKNQEGSKVQLFFSSIGCNVKRYMRYMQKCVENTPKAAI